VDGQPDTGPWPVGGSIVGPAEHIAFPQRLRDRGVLVAAGSLDGPTASGMTIIRVPDPVDVATYIRMAQEDDQRWPAACSWCKYAPGQSPWKGLTSLWATAAP
jgi:hypothetical protein